MAVFRNLVLAVTLLVGAAVVLAVGFPETPLGDRLLSIFTREAVERGGDSDVFYQYVDRTGAVKIVDDLALVPADKRGSVDRIKATGKKLQRFSSPGSQVEK